MSLCCSKYPPIAGLLIINLNKIFAAKFKSFNNCKDYEKALTICLLVLGFAGGVLAQPRSINGVIKTMLKELSVNRLWDRFNKASNGDKLMRMNYDIHTGAILGLFGKIIAFTVSLTIATMPITGYIMWHQKHKRMKQSRKG